MGRSGMCGAVVVRYSGATVRDFFRASLRFRHPVPYSPRAVARGTRSCVGLSPKSWKRTVGNMKHGWRAAKVHIRGAVMPRWA